MLAQSTAGLEAERSWIARIVGRAYLVVFAAQFLLALSLVPSLLRLVATDRRPATDEGRASARLEPPERFFLIMLGFYGLYLAFFRQNTLEHPYLYSLYLVIALAVSTFVLPRSPHPVTLTFRSPNLYPVLANSVGALTLIVSLVHAPWRLHDHLRLIDPAYPDQAAVRTIARYLQDHFVRPRGVILVLNAIEPGVFIAEHLMVNAAALAYVQRPEVRVKVLTSDRFGAHPASVEAYAVTLFGSDLTLPVQGRGLFHLGFQRIDDSTPAPSGRTSRSSEQTVEGSHAPR